MPPDISHRGTEETTPGVTREEERWTVKRNSTKAGTASAPAKPCRIKQDETTDVCPKETAADIEDVTVIALGADSANVLPAVENEFDVDATGNVGQGVVADSSTDDEKAVKETSVKEIENPNNRALNVAHDDIATIETAVSTEKISNLPPWAKTTSDMSASVELTPDTDSSAEKAWDSIVSTDKPSDTTTKIEKTQDTTAKTATVKGAAVPGEVSRKPPAKTKAEVKYSVSWGDTEPENPIAPVVDLIDSADYDEVSEQPGNCYDRSSVTIRVMFRKRTTNREDAALAPF